MSETIVEYGEKELESQALSLLGQASLVFVTDEASYQTAGLLIREIKKHADKIKEYFKPLKEAAYKAHRQITQREADELKPLMEADNVLRATINKYLQDQELIRKKAQEKAEAEAREKARIEKEKLLAQAIKAEEKGRTDKAEILIEKAEQVYVAPVVIPVRVEKTTRFDDGRMTRKTDTKVTVTDPLLLCKAIGDKIAPTTIVEFKPGMIKTWVKAMGLKNGDVPGLLIEEIQSVIINR